MNHRPTSETAFTLLEILVALAILAVMMAFLFSLIGSGARLWDTGNKRIEATQAARVGLNTIERELRQAFAGSVTTYTSAGNAVTNTAPFQAIDTPNDTLNLGGGAANADGSQQLRAVVSTGDPSDPYKEIALMCVRIGSGYDAMEADRYYLVLKSLKSGDFYLQAATATWDSNNGSTWNFIPLTDNCIRLTFRYYGDPATGDPESPGYAPDWHDDWAPANPPGRLPLGVLVTLTVLDSKTAEKIKVVTGGGALSDNDITAGIAAAQGQGTATSDLQRLIAQGAVTMSRFIPLNQN